MELLNDLLNQASNLSNGALVVIGVLVFGYVVKAIPQIPNGLIPLLTLALAITLQLLTGDRSQVSYTVRYPDVRLGMVGGAYWAFAWLVHNQGLRRLEKFLPAPLRGLLGVEIKDEPPTVKDTQMKNLLMLVALLATSLNCSAAWVTPDPLYPSPLMEWTAPNPALPDTEWYDYGEGSTSNGPTPAGQFAAAPRQTGAIRAVANPPTAPPPSKSWVNSISVSPYATVAFEDFDKGATGGVGLDVGIGISKTVSLVAFGEADDVDGSFVDRAGLGLRVTGRLTKAVSIFGQMSGGYSFSDSAGLGRDDWFIRPQFGGSLDFWRKGNAHVGLTGSWGLDVDLDGHTAQRLFGGLVAGTSF